MHLTRKDCHYTDCPDSYSFKHQRYCNSRCHLAEEAAEKTRIASGASKRPPRLPKQGCHSCVHGKVEPQSDTGYMCTIGQFRACSVWTGKALYYIKAEKR